METLFVPGRDLHRRLALRERGRDDLVLAAVDDVLTHVADIGDVLHVCDAPADVLERAAQPVRQEIGAKVAQMDRAIHGGPAGVQPDLAVGQRDERLDAAGERVEETKLHGPPLATA